MANWQYLVVFIEDSKVADDQEAVDHYLDADRYTEQLNQYGQAGWELVTFESNNAGAQAVFKRPES
jgi:hypothetical protein